MWVTKKMRIFLFLCLVILVILTRRDFDKIKVGEMGYLCRRCTIYQSVKDFLNKAQIW